MSSTENAYSLSLNIITRNRSASLRRSLRSIRDQNVQPLEILVGDDSDPERAEENRKLTEEFSASYFAPDGNRGVYRNRNRLARASRGTHVRTMDDDHEFPPGHLDICYRAINSDPDSVWIIGEHRDEVPVPFHPPYCPGQLNARGFGELPADPQHCWAIADGATILPKVIFEPRGIYFYENFLFGSAFMELGCRLAWLGYRIRLLDNTFVLHHCAETHRQKDALCYGSRQIALGSRLFAALCHSFIYRRGVRNQTITCLEMCKELLLRRGVALQAISKAYRAYRDLQEQLKSIPRLPRVGGLPPPCL